MRRTILLLTTMAAMLATYAGAALAQTAAFEALDANTLGIPQTSTAYGFFPGVNQAQTFTAEHNGDIAKAKVKIHLDSSFAPINGLKASITTVDTATGVPTSNVLASTTIPSSDVPVRHVGEDPNNIPLTTLTFTNPARVEAGKQYAILLDAIAPDTPMYVVRWTTVLSQYAGGQDYAGGRGMWVNDNGSFGGNLPGQEDQLFAIYVTTTDPDATAPVISGMPSDITATATGSGGAQVSWQAPTATDDRDGDVGVECSPASGSTFPVGTTTVSCTAQDAAGNKATETFNVNVVYSWSGVLQPINGGGTLNDLSDDTSLFKSGSTVPVRFKLTGDSAGIKDATARIILVKLDGTPDGTEVEATSTNAPDSGGYFGYNSASAQYVYNLGTKGLSAGDYLIKIDLGDGTTATNTVRFSLKR